MIRHALFWVGIGLVLVAPNALIAQKEALVRRGAKVILALAPVDPRSLMEGDYMSLNYELDNLWWQTGRDWPDDGALVVKPDGIGVSRFVRRDDGQPLAPFELRVRYRKRKQRIKIGAEAFYFQEGQGALYRNAKYGELRVTTSGDSVLVRLLNERREPLGPKCFP
jgi:uncharacterized membrane-anchored protein